MITDNRLTYIAKRTKDKDTELRCSELLQELREFRQTFIRSVTVTGPYNINYGVLGSCSEELKENNPMGTLTVVLLPSNEPYPHCFFKDHNNETRIWCRNIRGWEKYEELLFNTWSIVNGECLQGDGSRETAKWIVSRRNASLFEKVASDIEKLASPLQAFSEYGDKMESVLEIIRNGLPKWHPCKIDWVYVKNIDTAIKRLESGITLSLEPDSNKKLLPSRFLQAYQSYCHVMDVKPELNTDKKAHDWLKENGYEDYALPPFKTWLRYVQAGRKVHCMQKNSPRSGRTGRSIVSSSDLAPPRKS